MKRKRPILKQVIKVNKTETNEISVMSTRNSGEGSTGGSSSTEGDGDGNDNSNNEGNGDNNSSDNSNTGEGGRPKPPMPPGGVLTPPKEDDGSGN
jgi:hypothetical protein